MSEAKEFLLGLARLLTALGLYGEDHPARTDAAATLQESLRVLLGSDPHPRFAFLDEEVVYGNRRMEDLGAWEWAGRLSRAGVQRLELTRDATPHSLALLVDRLVERLGISRRGSRLAEREGGGPPSSEATEETPDERTGEIRGIRFGLLGLEDLPGAVARDEWLAVAGLPVGNREERETMDWVLEEAAAGGRLPAGGAESIVRSLSVAMHHERSLLVPLGLLKEADQYSAIHSMNVSVLAMALAEFVGYGPEQVRRIGEAGLLHDVGKTRIPGDILRKPGRLTPEEREVINTHPVEGARILLGSAGRLELAAVVAYEHHATLDDSGYPELPGREPHPVSRLVQVCDVYDAFRTRRPWRDPWEPARVLEFLRERAGTAFDAGMVESFARMIGQLEGRTLRVGEEGALAFEGSEGSEEGVAAPAERGEWDSALAPGEGAEEGEGDG